MAEIQDRSRGYAGDPAIARGTQVARDRDPNCIEMTLKNIEADLSEVLNSAENLADKLRGEVKAPIPPSNGAIGSDVTGRLNMILDGLRHLNQHLGRAHSSISG